MDETMVSVFRNFNEINYLIIFFIVVASWLLIEFVERVFPWFAGNVPERFRFKILPLVPVLRLIIWIVSIIWIVPMIIHPTPENLLALLGAVGLGVGFAFKDYVSSLAAGIVAIYERPYRPGDWVEIDGAYGEVKSLEARVLRMVTLDDTLVSIPHKKIWDSNIYNANDAKRELLCVANFYLNPTHDAQLVRQKLYDVALTSPFVQLKNPIRVSVAEKPWGTHYRLKAYPIEGRDQNLFTSDLTVRGKAALLKMGIELAVIPFASSERGRMQ
ncbi:MAG: mechanosensitive ion channel [Deltaproteobacteria bacterium]|jgi:small-conductance mechanosensitive channel|uniref:Mechanosensitive ion channel protein MscS n=2 Tax=Desulforhabdus amnigena TaxID=40218 RepID=A0A9W6D3U5_9BACT|nr:mechanosensitive ion channel [Deltaproteobacteria bacterium]GLI34404.1 mechanosensitive ion channel protein MscS [Desulforhabdus amnigena]